MSRFLLEIGSEEIPARMQPAAAVQLAKRFTDACAAAGLTHGHVSADATPRRLWLIADTVAAASAATAEERRGPRADAPGAALTGFLRSTGLTRDQLEERDTGKGVFLFATIKRDGRPAAEILSEIIAQIITGFDWPKSMRWGDASASTSSPRWVRPLTHIVALLGSDVVPASVFGLTSGRISRGHRIHAPGPLEIGSADTYAAQLRGAFVYASSFVRRQIIVSRAAEQAAAAGLTVIPDEGLEIENAGLTEWPVPLLGRFDPAFLAVPREIIQLTMRTNQKYFALADADGALAPVFVCVANMAASDDGAAIVAGNERVLSARLADAKFFWDQDLATVSAGGLEAFLPKLGDIVFHEKLGTVADKVERVAKLARWLVESGAIKPETGPVAGAAGPEPQELADMAETAARLSKADLVSATVGEFPEVQGIAGGYLARAASLDPQISDAIRDHYKPALMGDLIPTAPVSIAVALADKLDTLFGFFAIAETPTGSRDPYALRRAALGVISLLQTKNIRLSLFKTMIFGIGNLGTAIGRLQSQKENRAIESFLSTDFVANFQLRIGRDLKSPKDINWDESPVLKRLRADVMAAPQKLADFLTDRLKVQQRDVGTRSDIIDAAFAIGSEDDLVRLLARVRALQAFVGSDDGVNLLAGYKRAANILKAEDAKDGPHGEGGLDGAWLSDPAEVALAEALDAALPAAAAAVEAEDFTTAMAALASLRGPVDAFFTDLMVNAPEPAVRRNRLALLARFRDAVHTVADFSRIEG